MFIFFKAMKDKLNEELNDGHYLEMMDRLHIAMCMISDHIEPHPLADSDDVLKFEIERAIEHLANAYQRIGALDMWDKLNIQKITSK